MKYLIILLLLSSTASAQLDTMLIRQPITMQAQDLAWLRGKVGATRDSAILKSDRNVNVQLRATQGLTWTTNVSIDSLPGKLVYAYYQIIKKEAGENVARFTAIVNALEAVTQLTAWFTAYNVALESDRQSGITIGKYILFDQ